MSENSGRSQNPGPVLIELDAADIDITPATAPPVPDSAPAFDGTGSAMETAMRIGARRPSKLWRWFWSLAVALTGFFVSLAAWNTVLGLINSSPILGLIATALVAAFALVMLAIALREAAAFARLRRVDRLQIAADLARNESDLPAARRAVASLERLYKGREDMRWARARFDERKGEVLDADGLLDLASREFLAPLDQVATKEVEAAARQVAMVTAIVPLALADVITALTANIRMIRRIAEIYGGRSGTLGSLRLLRAVMGHLVATGAVAVGDDLIGSVAGGSVLSKLSRRFGEGIVNGALTARVGVAAMEVCRPLAFDKSARPSVTGVVKRALAGLFGATRAS